MAKSEMITLRLPPGTARALQGRATRAKTTRTEVVKALIDDALSMRGRDGLETRLAAMEATIAEQERIIAKAGRKTPRKKRIGMSVTLAEAAQIDKAARKAGQTRGEFLRERVFGPLPKQRMLPGGSPPALPLSAA